MIRKKRISIITVCYNAVKELEKTIQSVRTQTYNDYEFIIIDGGSTDGTVEFVNRNKDVVSVFISETDYGIYDAMNKGVKASSGEWLHMLNAGDTYADENVLSNIFAKPIPSDINVLFSDFYTYNKKGNRIRYVVDMINRPSFNHQCTIYRRCLHEKHGLYIVTPQIIISDILFFYSIPSNEIMKVDYVIAYFEGGGISSKGNWSLQQWLCADVVFRKRTFMNMICTYFYRQLRDSVPECFRSFVRNLIGWKARNIF